MKKTLVVSRVEMLLSGAVLAAHVSCGGGAFRTRDVSFLYDLFCNWVEFEFTESEVRLQAVQIDRYLDMMIKDGFARRMSRTKERTGYRLVRIGIIELLSRMVSGTHISRRGLLLFLIYYIKAYGAKLLEVIEREGRSFPSALRIEVEALLNITPILEREKLELLKSIRKIEQRIHQAELASELTKRELKGGMPFELIVMRLEKELPYELNSQKPLSQFIASIPGDIQEWELSSGNLLRAKVLWEPALGVAKWYLDLIQRFLRET